LFPHNGFAPSLETEYNKQSELEFEQIRDFLVLHYTVNERTDSAFFNDMRNITLPDSLAHKIALFKESGNLLREQNDLFLESSWLQVLYGQGITPKDYHGLVNSVPEVQLNQMLTRLLEIKKEPIAKLPTHDEYINGMVAKYKRAMS
jgi:Tryptophan halogenase.